MSSTEPDASFERELAVALDASRRAAEVILGFYDTDSAETYTKGDGSPVTDADLASDAVIRRVITSAFPDDALLTEEGARDEARLVNPRCWIVDPIDGTAQFVARTGLFDVMIALVIDGRPVVAASAHPVSGRIQAAVRGGGAWTYQGHERVPFTITQPSTPPRLVSSKWYGGRDNRRALNRIASALGSPPPSVLEVGFQARAFDESERVYDAFIGLPPASRVSIAQEWDLATVDLIVHEAGGGFTDCWGRLHQYNKRNTGISGGILASASPGLHAALLEAIAPELPGQPPAADPADDMATNPLT
jgi:3'-phosphoadenosine 5'-phosphosulfate (PAPS) 3'-phosphatase